MRPKTEDELSEELEDIQNRFDNLQDDHQMLIRSHCKLEGKVEAYERMIPGSLDFTADPTSFTEEELRSQKEHQEKLDARESLCLRRP